ncbi:MAG: hypothetical protein C0401_04470 [Anaerolinea sp.]|nr:hypothetical protein [Anaerolinea sp.]
MTDFLDFLNTADAETLKKLPGVTPSQADRILSARPFETLQDCSRVPSLTEKRLARLQVVYFEQIQTPIPTEDLTENEEQKDRLETEPDPQETQPKQSKPGRVGRILIRILIILLLLTAVAAAIYYGVPFLYEKFVRPVETNAASITDLTAQQNAEVARLDEEIAALQARMSTLELRADTTDQTLKAYGETLANLEVLQNLLDQKLTNQKDELLLEIANQIKLTRGIELLSRSRLYLSQSNYGLAKIDLLSSRNLLYSLLASLPADQVGAMKIVINRIDMALINLPTYPVVAVYDVDTAWQLLVDGLPNVPAQAVTPVVLPPLETTIPTAAVEVTPTP